MGRAGGGVGDSVIGVGKRGSGAAGGSERVAVGARAGAPGPRRRCRGLRVPGLGLALLTGACAAPTVSDLDAYQPVEMSRTAAFPTEAERAKQVFEVAVVERPSPGLDEARLREPRAQVRLGLEQLAASFGAAVIDRTRPGFDAVRSDRPRSEFEGVDAEVVPSGDYAISARFTTLRHAAVWTPPTKLPWQSEEEAATKPGTCTHTAEVGFDVELVRKGWEDSVERVYLLNHRAVQENKDLDRACTIAPVTVETLFETAIAEALACLELPLGTRISPRGWVLAHRRSKEGERHIYRVSLGLEHGVDAEEPLEFRRVEIFDQSDGTRLRRERVIATGVATTQITPRDAWVAVSPDDVKAEILEGDLVKRHFQKGLLTNLTGPDCKKILAER